MESKPTSEWVSSTGFDHTKPPEGVITAIMHKIVKETVKIEPPFPKYVPSVPTGRWIVSARGKVDKEFMTKREATDYLDETLKCEWYYDDEDFLWTNGETVYYLSEEFSSSSPMIASPQTIRWIVSARGKVDKMFMTKSEALSHVEHALGCEQKYEDDEETWTNGETTYNVWCKKTQCATPSSDRA